MYRIGKLERNISKWQTNDVHSSQVRNQSAIISLLRPTAAVHRVSAPLHVSFSPTKEHDERDKDFGMREERRERIAGSLQTKNQIILHIII